MKDRYECACGKLYTTLMQVKCKCSNLYDHKNQEEIYKSKPHDGTRRKN